MKWWQSAVFYQIYIRSFSDGSGDGVGDFPGILSRLDYLEWLGVDAIWITPFYPSPMADHGYDVTNYYDVDPLFGTLEEAGRTLEEAHARGIKVIVDIVPNHTSDRHPWFQNALSNPSHSDREKYLFRAPAPGGGPPNNWRSVFGGPAWTFHEPSGQYYLHLFAPEQPDLNWRNPEVHEHFDEVLRFWLDRGVDGFRIDVAHGLYKDEQLRDHPQRRGGVPGTQYQDLEETYAWDQPEVHEVYRMWRKLADSYSGDRVLVGEVFIMDPARVAPYLRPGELHLAFNFFLVMQPWAASSMKDAIDLSMQKVQDVGSRPTWVLSNHDLERHVTRFGGGKLGRRRAGAALLMMLGLPGSAFIYQGEELGLEQVDIPDHLKQDPIFFRTEGSKPGRDGCRVPIPWVQAPPGFGFTAEEPWLPMPEDWGRLSVAAQKDDPASMLSLYRKALRAREKSAVLAEGDFAWVEGAEGILAYERIGEQTLVCVCNFSSEEAAVDLKGDLILASDDDVSVRNRKLALPGDSAAWIST